MLQFTAKAIKATLVLNAAEVAATDVVGDTAFFTIAVGDQKVTGKFNAKTFRRVVALVREHGADAVAVVAQGKLVNGRLEEAGITGQLRTPKPVADILV
jgi:phage terminase large subunit-like protein